MIIKYGEERRAWSLASERISLKARWQISGDVLGIARVAERNERVDGRRSGKGEGSEGVAIFSYLEEILFRSESDTWARDV